MRKEGVNKSNRKEISEYERSGSLLIGIIMGLFYSEGNPNNTSLNWKWEMAMTKLIRFYTLVAILSTTLLLNLSAVPKAEATYSDTLYYSNQANYYDYYASYYKTLAVYSSSSYEYNAQYYAYYAYLYAYYAYLYAPSGTNTDTYAYYSYYYGYYRYLYANYEYLYTGYEYYNFLYDSYFDYYRGLATYYAAILS